MKLSEYLGRLGLSNSEVKKALRNGKVFFDGIPTQDGGRDIEPFQVELRLDATRLTPGRDLVFIYRDDDIVVFWKPSGMLSVPAGKAGGHLNALGLVGKLTRSTALAVHRIDQGSSGLMMVALNRKAQLHIKEQLEKHTVERRYIALVLGRTPDKEWSVENHLVEDRGDGMRGSIEPPFPKFARFAKTQFTLLERVGKKANLVEARLHTGRTHQVRIHLSEAGMPIFGDDRYGSPASQRAATRLCLHALVLGVEHPSSGEKMRFTCPLPDDMEKLRRALEYDSAKKRIKRRRPKKRR
jgi:23S rRNA pseudouridine1911/1915/1917 synthase